MAEQPTRQQLINDVSKFHSAIVYMASQKGNNRCWLDWIKLFKKLPEGYEFALPNCNTCQCLCEQYYLCQRLEDHVTHPGIRLVARDYSKKRFRNRIYKKTNGDLYFPQYAEANAFYIMEYHDALKALKYRELKNELAWLLLNVRKIRDKELHKIILADHRLIYSRLLIPLDIELALPTNFLDNCKNFICLKHKELQQNPNADLYTPPPDYQAVDPT